MIKSNSQNRNTLTARYKERINNNLMLITKDAEKISLPIRSTTPVVSNRS